MREAGSKVAKFRRIRLTNEANTAALAEVATASFSMGRTANTATFDDVTATLVKYGDYVNLTDDLMDFSPTQTNVEIAGAIGENAGRTLNRLQRDVGEDNSPIIYPAGAASDGDVDSAITAPTLDATLNALDRNNALPFTAMTTGSQNEGTSPVLPAFWGICHTDVARDIARLNGFKSVETYAGQTSTAMGEFGIYQGAGVAVRFIRTTEATIDLGAGAATSSSGLRGDTNINLYTTLIYGREAIGSVGLGRAFPDGIYRVGEQNMPSVEMVFNPRGSGGVSDPLHEISTLGWKSRHAGVVLNSTWTRALKTGATAI
jgi:N4-gp56 family major capsid protein